MHTSYRMQERLEVTPIKNYKEISAFSNILIAKRVLHFSHLASNAVLSACPSSPTHCSFSGDKWHRVPCKRRPWTTCNSRAISVRVIHLWLKQYKNQMELDRLPSMAMPPLTVTLTYDYSVSPGPGTCVT